MKTLVLAFNLEEYKLYLRMKVPRDKWRDHLYIQRPSDMQGFAEVGIVKTERFGKRTMTFDQALDFHNMLLNLISLGSHIVQSRWNADNER